ncbi:MAG: hypothetical protein DRJ61_14135 [Acidobacteria bacterium]|nr:MAG: hypothetical protein DRJ61_14135 [Acidobacteriota bacterium]
MKAIIILIVVVIVGLLAFNYFTTGEFTLMSSGAGGGEAQELNQLRGEFRSLAREFRQAGRSAAISGMDTTSAASAVLAELDGVEKKVMAIAKTAEDSEVAKEAKALAAEIAKYKKDIQ